MADKRKYDRRPFTHYVQVLDDDTGLLIGYLSDISLGGFKLDCGQRVPVGHDFQLAIQLNSEIADKLSLILIARSRWCRPAYIDPTTFHVGFQIMDMAPEDFAIFERMYEKYGSQKAVRSSDNYLWR